MYLTKPGTDREGPYEIDDVPSAKKYTLRSDDGELVNDGEEVNEENLAEA